MQLSARYPDFQLLIQDRASVIERALAIWNTDWPSAVSEGKVTFIVHGFFKANPVVGADVWHILREWPDTEAINILSRIGSFMGNN
ncbi:hypothetical protein LTR41_011486 [Exophiala xenobiotica]|nr:hypothetical protein LTR41_011486 [Exophiala xenobiotica]KAK5550523.1 hypothetical protein LTR46_011474 [Exophiala xenobiotica]